MKLIIVLVFIVLDLISGVICALKKGNFTSKGMKKGLYAKSGELLLLLLSYLISYCMRYYDIGYSNSFYIIVSTYIITMEIGSIVENIGKINPNLIPAVIKKCFKQLRSDNNENK